MFLSKKAFKNPIRAALATLLIGMLMQVLQWPYSAGIVFISFTAIIFPAFTGMTAGVGLSGDLKDPKKSIPTGTDLLKYPTRAISFSNNILLNF